MLDKHQQLVLFAGKHDRENPSADRTHLRGDLAVQIRNDFSVLQVFQHRVKQTFSAIVPTDAALGPLQPR
jgi:hypothetical protein